MSIHLIQIDNWHPPRLNEWAGCHWSVGAKLKLQAKLTVRIAGLNACIPLAVCKRRVSLRITLAPRARGGDPDAYWKSLLDALVQGGYLVDDSKEWVELGPVEYDRGERRATTITLEDLL